MKKFRFLTLLWVIVFATTLAGCWNNNNWNVEDNGADAVINYNDNLVDTASTCIASEDLIRNTYDDQNSSIEDIKNAIDNTIKECTTAQKNIKSLWDWEWDSSLKDWALNIIEKYITYYSKFSELLPYVAQEEITEEQNEKYQSLLAEIESLDNELNQANEDLITIQEQFAKKHWFLLESDEEENSSYEEIDLDAYNEDIDTSYEEENTLTEDESDETYEEETEEETEEE